MAPTRCGQGMTARDSTGTTRQDVSGTAATTERLREHLRAALADADQDETRRHLREALQLVDAIEEAAGVIETQRGAGR